MVKVNIWLIIDNIACQYLPLASHPFIMSFTAKLINGSLRYRATKALESILELPSWTQNASGTSETHSDNNANRKGSITSRLRQYPLFLSLPALTLPSQLDAAAISYLRDHSLSSPRAIEGRAEMLGNYLWSRPLATEVRWVSFGLFSFPFSISG